MGAGAAAPRPRRPRRRPARPGARVVRARCRPGARVLDEPRLRPSGSAYFGFEDRYAVLASSGEDVHGPGHAEVAELAAEAVAFVNLSGTVSSQEHQGGEPPRRLRRHRPRLDPALARLRQHGRPRRGHDPTSPIGENVGTPGCSLPTGGIEWRHTASRSCSRTGRAAAAAGDRFTTLARSARPVRAARARRRDARAQGDEFRKVIELPAGRRRFRDRARHPPADPPTWTRSSSTAGGSSTARR